MQRVRAAIVKASRALGVPKPLPNPEWYTPERSFWWDLSLAEKKQCCKEGWADYCEGWRNEFGSTPEQDEEWRAAVKDNVNAAGEIYGDVKGSSSEVHSYVLKWVGVYRATIEQFSSGYKEGVAPPPPPTERVRAAAPVEEKGPTSDRMK